MSTVTAPTASEKTTSVDATSSDRRQWQRIFRTLVGMLQEQESQIQTLIDDRKFLEDYVQLQHDRWVSKARLLTSQVAQIKDEEEMWRRTREAKLDLLLGLKEKEAECYREHLDLLKSDLDDLYGCIECLSQQDKELIVQKRIEPDKQKKGHDEQMKVGNNKENEQHATLIEEKLRKLKHEFKSLSSQKEAEISSLLAEKNFIWNQFKKIDDDFTSLRMTKHIELEQAHEAVENLQLTVENLQSVDAAKDNIITNLRATISELELNLGTQAKKVEQTNDKLKKVQADLDRLGALVYEKDEIISKLRKVQVKHEVTSCQGNNGLYSKSVPSRKIGSSGECFGSSRCICQNGSRVARQTGINTSGNSSRSCSSGKINGPRHCSTSKKRSIPRQEDPVLFSANFKIPKLKDELAS